MKYPLLSVLWTLTHEPGIVKSALFKPSDPTKRKPLVMPENYWRFEVLKPLLGNDIDKFPNAVKNHFCPLFWLSNFAPIWLLWGAIRLLCRLIKKAVMSVVKLLDTILDWHFANRKEKKRLRKKAQAKGWLERWLEGPTPDVAWDTLGNLEIWKPKELEKMWSPQFLDKGKKWDWANPPQKLLDYIEKYGEEIDCRDSFLGEHIATTLQLIGLKRRHGREWRKELRAMAERYLLEEEERARRESEESKIYNSQIALATIWAKRIGTWILWALTIPAIWAACWVAYWIYAFALWLFPLLMECGSWLWDGIWNLFAYHTPTIALALVGIVAIWIISIFIYNGLTSLFSYLGKKFKAPKAPGKESQAPEWLKAIGRGVEKALNAVAEAVGLLIDIIRMTYNNNCPAIERAKAEEDKGNP